MEPNWVEFLENKTILVTGATGFLAKVFMEKILREQPNVKKLYLLVRACDIKTAKQRLHSQIFEKKLFRVIRNNLGDENLNMLISEKVVPVVGDISMENLGVRDHVLLENMRREIDIVVNSAATTDFDERYEVALGINTFGALNVLNFAKKCVLPQLLLHVSTAYVCGERAGLILEKPFAMGETLNGNNKLDVTIESHLAKQKLKKLVEQGRSEDEIKQAMKDFGMKRAKLYGWPNTYVFTKAMGEMLLGYNRESMPIVIVRPTMITSTLSEPFPGWIEGLRTIDSVIIGYAKGRLHFFPGDLKTVFDVIPVDMVVNVMLTVAAGHSGDAKSHIVYHVGSSSRNPLTLRQIRDFSVCYFLKSPLIGNNNLPINVVSKFMVISSMPLISLNMLLHYRLPLQILQLLSVIHPWRYGDEYRRQSRKMKMMVKLMKLYKPYVYSKCIFDNENIKKLQIKRKSGAKEMKVSFDVDPKCINWEDYFETTHISGLITHVLKN